MDFQISMMFSVAKEYFFPLFWKVNTQSFIFLSNIRDLF